MKKKIFTFFTIGLLCLSIIGCASKSNSKKSSSAIATKKEVAATFEKILKGEASFINTANGNRETYISDVVIKYPGLSANRIDKTPDGIIVADVNNDGCKDLILHFSTSDAHDYDMTIVLPYAKTIYSYNLGSRVSVYNNGLVTFNNDSYYTGDEYHRCDFKDGSFSTIVDNTISSSFDPDDKEPETYRINEKEVTFDEYKDFLEEHKEEFSTPEYYEFTEANIDRIIEALKQ